MSKFKVIKSKQVVCETPSIGCICGGGCFGIESGDTYNWLEDIYYCEECGRHPITDNKQIRKLKEPIRTIVGMMMLSVDHIEAGDRSSDKYTNSNNINHKDKCKTVCDESHKLKTYLTGDHWSNSFHGEK